MSSILEQLGIHGISEQNENAILSGLFTGDPVLFIGAPGTAKTECIIVLANCLREISKKKNIGSPNKIFNFHVYDSSKLNFEELIGIPNPEKMRQGLMEFIETPTTIWNKKLVSFDELNRAEPDRLSNILEILRNRTCYGIPTGTFFIFNAMNPYGDAGTNILSEALVDRHSIFIEFPEFKDMSIEDREKIIDRVGNFDGVALKYWTKSKGKLDVSQDLTKVNDELADIGLKLNQLLQDSATIYNELHNSIGKRIKYLILKTFDSLGSISDSSKETTSTFLSGRRAGLIYRVILSYRSVEIAKSKVFNSSIEPLIESIKTIYPMAIPFGISGALPMEVTEKAKRKLVDDILLFWPQIEKDSTMVDSDLLFELFGSSSIARKIIILLNLSLSDEATKNLAWNSVLNNIEKANSSTKGAILSVSNIISAITMIDPELVPDNVKSRLSNNILNLFTDATKINQIELRGSLAYLKPMIENLCDKWKNSPLIMYFIYDSINTLNPNTPRNINISRILELEDAASIINNKLMLINQKKENLPKLEKVNVQ